MVYLVFVLSLNIFLGFAKAMPRMMARSACMDHKYGLFCLCLT
jgi:hypothetical protein